MMSEYAGVLVEFVVSRGGRQTQVKEALAAVDALEADRVEAWAKFERVREDRNRFMARNEKLREALLEAVSFSLLEIRKAAFGPEIGVRYTEAIRADIADKCRALEDSIRAALDEELSAGVGDSAVTGSAERDTAGDAPQRREDGFVNPLSPVRRRSA